jgi:hypothetical protein
MIESLEGRTLLSFTITGPDSHGAYTATGTNLIDVGSFDMHTPQQAFLYNGMSYPGAYSLNIYSYDGDDRIDIVGDSDPWANDHIGVNVKGGFGADIIDSSQPLAMLDGEDGNDTITNRGRNAMLKGGKGRDDLSCVGAAVWSVMDGGDNNDLIDASLLDSIFDPNNPGHFQGISAYGGNGSDDIHGSDGCDWLEGGGGTGDKVYGLGDDDTLWMVDGAKDTISDGGSGYNKFHGDSDPNNPNSPLGLDGPVNCQSITLY